MPTLFLTATRNAGTFLPAVQTIGKEGHVLRLLGTVLWVSVTASSTTVHATVPGISLLAPVACLRGSRERLTELCGRLGAA